ncbi:MAG: hypothetical protein K0S00_331 [Xanthobacteraceae bacterium]|jgi:uncharacterized membrane protein YbhN (UPF0104 family)|nr:hypothetical protein [Xanthobacteraceae bacterium]
MKRLFHWLGTGLALIGGGFVALRLHDYAGEIDIARILPVQWIALGGLAVFYGAASVLLALAWRRLLAFCGVATSIRWTVGAYGSSQLAKYIPGNIFQFAGRQAIGMAAGYRGWALARSTLWELGLISWTAGVFALLAVHLAVGEIPIVATLLAFALALAGSMALVARLFSPHVAVAMGEQALFLSCSGAVFVGCLLISMPEASTPFDLLPAVAGAFVIAWLVGMATPGSPAGLGVRELVLLFLLTGIGCEPDVLLAIVLGRIVNVAGDALFFALGVFLGRAKT